MGFSNGTGTKRDHYLTVDNLKQLCGDGIVMPHRWLGTVLTATPE